jgi:hypothetical protein
VHYDVRNAPLVLLWVSNSLSGRDWESDEVPAVGDPTHIVQIGWGYRVSTGEEVNGVWPSNAVWLRASL